MKSILFLPLYILFFTTAYCQYNIVENKVWAFGHDGGLDFNSGAPIPFHSAMNQIEGSASVCDRWGNLLFYTNGKTVYNRAGTVMPSGNSIVPYATWSTTQAAVIVPVLGVSNQYYIFSLESMFTDSLNRGRLSYSIVDMTLDGGFGDVIPSSAGILIDSMLAEKLTTVPGTDCNVWLIAHRSDSAKFLVYEITAAGVSISSASFVGAPYSGSFLAGVLKSSPNGNKLAMQSRAVVGNGRLELCDFNRNTGVVSNCRTLDTSSNYYGAEFSPDNSKLYVDGAHLSQYNVSLSTTAAIIASKTNVGPAAFGDMKLATDGKIYCLSGNSYHTALDCISYPNMSGSACGYVATSVNVFPAIVTYGLSNTVVTSSSAIVGSTAICIGQTETLTSLTPGGTWSSDNPSVATVGATSGVISGLAAGAATISYTVSGCVSYATVTVLASPAAIAGSATVCTGSAVTYASATPGGTWSSSNTAIATVGSTSGTIKGISTGTCVITYSLGHGSCFVTRTITVFPAPAAITGVLGVCPGQVVTLTCGTPGGTWSSSNPSVVAAGSTSGIITCTGVSGAPSSGAVVSYTIGTGCYATAVVTINLIPFVDAITGNDSVCVGDTIILNNSVATGTWVAINPRATVTGSGIVTGVSAGLDTILYIRVNGVCSASAWHPVTVYSCVPTYAGHLYDESAGIKIFPNPSSGLFSLCNNGSENVSVIITNLLGQKIDEFMINNGSLRQMRLQQPPGIYFAYITDRNRKQLFKIIVE